MVTPEIISYIKIQLAAGKTREIITNDLVKGGGWSSSDVAEAFNSIADSVIVKKKNYTFFKVLLVVIFIALLGYGGWYVYEKGIVTTYMERLFPYSKTSNPDPLLEEEGTTMETEINAPAPITAPIISPTGEPIAP